MKTNDYSPAAFVKIVHHHKYRLDKDGFIKLLQNCGLHKDDQTSVKHEVPGSGVIIVKDNDCNMNSAKSAEKSKETNSAQININTKGKIK